MLRSRTGANRGEARPLTSRRRQVSDPNRSPASSAIRCTLRRHSSNSASGSVARRALERLDDLAARQSRPRRPAHREDERPAEARVVGVVERVQPRELRGRALRQARARLFVGGLRRQRARHHRLARQLGCARSSASCASRPPARVASASAARGARGRANGRCASAAARSRASARRCRPAARPPRRDRGVEWRASRSCGARAAPGSAGASAGRCRCGGTPTRGRGAATWSRKRCSATMRPGRPSSRQCMPTLIMRGVSAPSAYSASNESRR